MVGTTAQDNRAFPAGLLRRDGRTAADNERRILSLLRRAPGLSRPELARVMEIATFSAARLVDGLLERGLVVEGEAMIKGRGHPSPALSLRGEAVHSVGISLMTDAVHLVLLDFTGRILSAAEIPLPRAEPSSVARRLRREIDSMLADHGLDRTTLAGAGLGITGYFVGADGQVNPPDPLGAWALVDLAAILRPVLGCELWIDNDGNVAALGEALFGAGRQYRSFAYLFFAAGFGGGVVIDGELVRGRNGNAGEFGSSLPAGFPVPNLERLRAAIASESGRPLGLAEALDIARLDTPGVAEWLDDASTSLNLVISSIAGALDPEAIVFGGRLPAELGEALIARLHFHNPERRGHARPMPLLLPSAVRGDAAAMGAATIPLKAAFF